MRTYAIETQGVNQTLYLVYTIDPPKLKSIIVSDQTKKILAERQLTPTGRIFSAEAIFNKESFMLSPHLPTNSQEIESMLEVDVLADQINRLDEKKKEVEKRLKVILDACPNFIKIGFKFGAFHTFTKSTSLAYSELYNTAKQMLIKGENSKDILGKILDMEKSMKSPHKSSAKTLKIFELDCKDEDLQKVWL